MIRLIGALMIGTVSTYCGFAAAERLKQRRELIKGFISSLKAMETEILFGRGSLGEIFRRLDGRFIKQKFYGVCADYIERMGIKKAWETSLSETAQGLKAEEYDILNALGGELGMSDTDGQKRAIDHVCTLLERVYDEADKEYVRLAGVYRKCGILCGAFIILAVI